ncbi:hypothetical protein [Siphonobacter sp.]|uniref:hypothetical protein n=1 Tax=Siphonobacter sp. TaxID=1869184 RepID=UPI003B3B70B0
MNYTLYAWTGLLISLFTLPAVLAQSENSYLSNQQIQATLSDSSELSFDMAAWHYSFIGEYNKSLAAFDHNLTADSLAQISPLPPNTVFTPAAAYIVKQSRGKKLVIINEAHHQPLHRVFTESLLEGLYAQGFRYLGLETLAEDSLINLRKWPLVEDGYYSREPQFGNLLRKALNLGFRVFGYEGDSSGSVREKGQARNIYQVLQKDPTAKILIHCGFAHVVEGPYPSWGKAMAGELKALSGLDPLTIEQQELTEHSEPAYESAYYNPGTLTYAAILLDKQGHPIRLDGESEVTDLQVIHPRSQFVHGRPRWLLRNGSWREVSLKKIRFQVAFPCLVKAYYPEEENSVPVDQIELRSPAQQSLILPPGSFVVELTDSQGKTQKETLTVK